MTVSDENLNRNESIAKLDSISTADRARNFLSRRRKYWLVAGVGMLAVLAYLAGAAISDRMGYPIDDSWIHQTYARNLARSGRWEFVPGTVSAGSTSPMWTLILSVGYLLGLPHMLWTFLLGWICLVWSGWAAMRLWSVLWPQRKNVDWIAGVIVVLSWPLVWAAGSGMETLLFVALELEVLHLYGLHVRERRSRVMILGLLAGLLVLTRPEGLVLLALLAVGLLISGNSWSGRLKILLQYLAGTLLSLVPYFVFNLWVSGNIWPNTFYAKQVEYGSAFVQPVILRFFQLLYFSLGGVAQGWRGISGAHLLLLPGVIVSAYFALRRDWKNRQPLVTIPLLWAIGVVFLYAWRLPVTYQHGRYLFPVIPIWILYGINGWLTVADRIKIRLGANTSLNFILTRFGVLTFSALLVIFLFLGLQVYAEDVAFVNGEMVDVSLWLRDNTPSSALVAAHDIGAIGFFAERPILDLAGLISPEVIDLLPDEANLTDYVAGSQAEYLVTAPGWTYDSLTKDGVSRRVYSTGFAWTLEQGVNNMEVFHLLK